MKKIIIYVFAILSGKFSCHAQDSLTIYLRNILDAPIQFILLSPEKDSLKSDKKGVLTLSSSQLSSFANINFQSMIVSIQLRQLYDRNLFYDKSTTSDFIDRDSVTIAKLKSDKDRIFYLKPKEKKVVPKN